MKVDAEALSRREILKALGCGAAAVATGVVAADSAPVADPMAVRQLEKSVRGAVVARETPASSRRPGGS